MGAVDADGADLATDPPSTDPPSTDPPSTGPTPASSAGGATGRRATAEVWIVLGLSLGQSAVYSVISLTAKLTQGTPLAAQTATLNASRSPRPNLDLTYQLADVVFTLVPVALALWLLAGTGRAAVRLLGLDLRRPVRDLAHGALLAAVIGLPGLALYAAGRQLGITAHLVASGLAPYWWAVPVLVLQAVKNAVLEEVVVVGYLVTRLRERGWEVWAVVGCSALLRGSYHLYQGFGPFLGNAVMGVVFSLWFVRRRRVMPLVAAHTLLDVVAFVGYQLFADRLGL
jgi:membrane protease YdiL (CAAX protease family)